MKLSTKLYPFTIKNNGDGTGTTKLVIDPNKLAYLQNICLENIGQFDIKIAANHYNLFSGSAKSLLKFFDSFLSGVSGDNVDMEYLYDGFTTFTIEITKSQTVNDMEGYLHVLEVV